MKLDGEIHTEKFKDSYEQVGEQTATYVKNTSLLAVNHLTSPLRPRKYQDNNQLNEISEHETQTNASFIQ